MNCQDRNNCNQPEFSRASACLFSRRKVSGWLLMLRNKLTASRSRLDFYNSITNLPAPFLLWLTDK